MIHTLPGGRIAVLVLLVAGLGIEVTAGQAWAADLTPTPTLAGEISVAPSTLSLGCQGSFDITITNTGATGTTLEISTLTLVHGYSQGNYGMGFSWDLSHIVLPASLASGATLTIPVTFSAAGQSYPSRLELTCDSNAVNAPHLFQVYFGGSQTACATPTATPTVSPTPSCVGDCTVDGAVTVDELLAMINIALGLADVATCEAGDANSDGAINIDEIIQAVNRTLEGCPHLPRVCGGIAGLPCAAQEVCDLRDPTCAVVDLAGVCVSRPEACLEVYDPVCGCDAVTYSNDCFRVAADATLAHAGACP